MTGYYLSETKGVFSVENYKNQWILRTYLDSDEQASTDEQINAIRGWQRSNKEKFYENLLRY